MDSQSSDSINAVSDGRTLDFKFVTGSDLKIKRIFEGPEQGDDVFCNPRKARSMDSLFSLLGLNSKKSMKTKEGAHYAYVLDGDAKDIRAYTNEEGGRKCSLH